MTYTTRILRAAMMTCLLFPSAAAWARFEPPPPCKNGFTREQEITEGAKVAAQVYKQMPVLPESDPLSRYVAQLGAKLSANAPGGALAWPYSFHVVASPDINAFALPGGAMFVNAGAIQAAETESQLAGVMAHEMSHVIMRHATCNITKQQRKSTWYGLGAIASEILLGGGAASSAAVGGLGMLQGVDFLHMSREDEMQADLMGTNILYQAGYDPRGLAQIFEIIQAKVGSGGSQFFSDHPNPGNRTRYVMDEIATLPPRRNQVVQTPEFKQAHALADSARTFTAEQVKAGVWRHGNYAAGPGPNGGTIASVADTRPTMSTEPTRSAEPTTSAGPATPAQYLGNAALGLDAGLATYRGPGFAMDVPGNWTATQSQDGMVTIAPAGGAGSFGIAYGAMVGMARTGSTVALDNNALLNATKQLVQRFTSNEGTLQQAGEIQPASVGGQRGYVVELKGQSPIADGGGNAAEHDLLMTMARPDGSVGYVVFVSPERDFGKLQPVFRQMAESLRPVELQ
ncbi:MAG TPA: M48 family metalloprotease [Acidobacteriaceae bacterium]|nr:M48 family metalloprotease [Acidobacteriaceae bacterium]